MSNEIAVILIRSRIGVSPDVKKTLDLLRLFTKNTCSVIKDSPNHRGMLRTIKDFVTWGDLSEVTKKQLIEKRKDKDESLFRLAPPIKGYGTKGIKTPFTMGGALGDRKEKINDLIMRMM
jgi:large subunit ribosomal protein L30